MAENNIGSLSESELLRIAKAPGAQYILSDATNTLIECNAGCADVKMKTLVTSDTTFNNFSVTKTATAAAILQLVEKKKILLTELANPMFHEFQFSYPFTIQQLVTHQAGFPDPIPISWVHLADEDEKFDENGFIAKTVGQHSRQKFVPGTRFSYSSIGYLLLSQIIERVSGQSYVSYISENVLSTLENDASLGFKINNEDLHATGYHSRFSFSNLLLSSVLDRRKMIRYSSGRLTAFRNFYVNGKGYGGFIGNAGGLASYLRLYLGRRMFSTEQMQHRMFTEQKGGMAYGWFTGKLDGEEYVCHAGGGGGYYCEIRIYPRLNIASAFVRNKSSFRDLRLLNKIDSKFLKTA